MCTCLSTSRWLRLVGSFQLYVSVAEYRLFNRALLQKGPIILRSLLTEATPYVYVAYTNAIFVITEGGLRYTYSFEIDLLKRFIWFLSYLGSTALAQSGCIWKEPCKRDACNQKEPCNRAIHDFYHTSDPLQMQKRNA